MVGQLITWPLRVGVRSTQLLLRTGEEIAWRAASLASNTAQAVLPKRAAPDRAQAQPPEPRVRRETPEPSARRETREPAPPRARRRTAPPIAPQPPAGEPTGASQRQAHVSEEPVVVRELAEPGAEDGAGAEVTVFEPWNGYAQMNAKQVIARIGGATPAELAAVTLYESGNRGRQTVLAAVEKELKATTGRARQTRKEQTNA